MARNAIELALLAKFGWVAGLVLVAALVLVLFAGQIFLGSTATADDLGGAFSCDASAGGKDEIPEDYMEIYERAAVAEGLGERGVWILAGIHKVESGLRDGRENPIYGPPTRYGRAVGPMQFLESTWAMYATDGDGDGTEDPQNPADAIPAAAKYLKKAGTKPGKPFDWYEAIFAYNHADWYVDKVEGQADVYQGTCTALDTTLPGSRARLTADGLAEAPEDAPAYVKRMIAAGNRIAKRRYVYGGGHGVPRDDYKTYDCSAAVSYVLHAGGLLKSRSTLTSVAFKGWGRAATSTAASGDAWVTVYTNDGHMFMNVAGLWFDNYSSRGGKSMWGTKNVHPLNEYIARQPAA